MYFLDDLLARVISSEHYFVPKFTMVSRLSVVILNRQACTEPVEGFAKGAKFFWKSPRGILAS